MMAFIVVVVVLVLVLAAAVILFVEESWRWSQPPSDRDKEDRS